MKLTDVAFISGLTVAVIIGTAYFKFVVAPHDAELHEVMKCMGSDNTLQAYNRCQAARKEKK
jgi:hypothetical protein